MSDLADIADEFRSHPRDGHFLAHGETDLHILGWRQIRPDIDYSRSGIRVEIDFPAAVDDLLKLTYLDVIVHNKPRISELYGP